MNKKIELAVLCENIKYLRTKNGLSKKEMAQIMGIGAAGVSKIENGIVPPRLNATVIVRLCEYFSLSASELFYPLSP